MPAAAKKTILASRSTEEIFCVAAGLSFSVLETHRGPHEAQGKKPHQGIFSKNRRLRLGPTWVKWSGTHQDRKCSRSKTVSGPALDAHGNTKYDPFGRRIQKAGPLGTTNYLYDMRELIEETDNSGNVLGRYTQSLAIDQPLAELRSTATSYYEQDGLGSVTSLSNSAASLANTYTYDSFGKLTASTGTISNPFQYAGAEFR